MPILEFEAAVALRSLPQRRRRPSRRSGRPTGNLRLVATTPRPHPAHLRLVIDTGLHQSLALAPAGLLPSLPMIARPILTRARTPSAPTLWPLVWIAAVIVAAASSVVQLALNRA